MSGHSHWAGIKHKKAAEDAKRGKVFSKLARIIALAAKEGGNNPATNPKLKDAIDYARSFNLPKDNIERAIKRGAGDVEGTTLVSCLLEAFGPGGTPLLVETITDNKNRTLAEIKTILAKHNGKLAGEGSVKWQFERKGIIAIKKPEGAKGPKEDLEFAAIDAGAEDLNWQEGGVLQIHTKTESLDKVKNNLKESGMKIQSATLGWVPKEEGTPEDEKTKNALAKLFEELDEHDDVHAIYSNISE